LTSRVLLLNVTFEPLTLVSPRRAIVLLISNKAEIVEKRSSAQAYHSERLIIEVPSVLKLTYYVKVPYRAMIPPLTRRAVLKRDGWKCAYCSAPADTIDHVIPRSRGGSHDWSNVVASCKKHNIVKGDRLLSELGWTLRFTPGPPRGSFWLLRSLEEVDPAWEPYIESAV
jgi:5-methylcytosine-specific restriction endonuclease McrA